jgi:hypothetical protein
MERAGNCSWIEGPGLRDCCWLGWCRAWRPILEIDIPVFIWEEVKSGRAWLVVPVGCSGWSWEWCTVLGCWDDGVWEASPGPALEGVVEGIGTCMSSLSQPSMATVALWTCIGVHDILLKCLSFLPFQMNHKVISILWRVVSRVADVIMVCKEIWMPSSSWGRVLVLKEGLKENQTA